MTRWGDYTFAFTSFPPSPLPPPFLPFIHHAIFTNHQPSL